MQMSNEKPQIIEKLDIPANAKAITPKWLTAALREGGAISQQIVTSVEVEELGPGAGYIGQLSRLKIGYAPTNENTPMSLITKFSSSDPGVRAKLHASGIYETEVRFYQELASNVQLPTPHYYYGDVDLQTGSSVLLLEDLSHFRQVDLAVGCNLAESELLIQYLADFHANWWQNSRLQSIHYLTPHSHRAEFWQEQYQEWWSQLPAKLETLLPRYQLPPAFLDLGRRFGTNVMRIFTQMSQEPITFIHKDTHLNNLLFSPPGYNRSLMVLDWQSAGYGRGVSDVTHFMVSSIPTTLRRKTERSLLQTYHHLLIESGVDGYDFESCWDDYKLSFFKNLFIIGILVGLLDTSSDQGRLLLRTLLPRVVAFSEDHDVEKYL